MRKMEKEALKEVSKINMPKEQAKIEWKKYCAALKKRKEKYLKIMKEAHYQMKEGKELIDIYEVMKKAGLNEKSQPLLAIARADQKLAYFDKRDSGTGVFGTSSSNWSSSIDWNKDRIELPQKTFDIHWQRKDQWRIDKKMLSTKVPIIPVELLPEGELKNYYILWEAKNWEELPETKDPFLLKRISENLFVILASWDLTPLEQSIIRGMK